MSFPKYPAYKDSGVEWLREVPEHWEIKKLKHCAEVFQSNVDKKTYDMQSPVFLCNYTDVYYNESIVADMEFMLATATTQQIEKFTLRAGDTVFTKDSEAAADIAIAAYVPEDLSGVIYGYHLAVARPFYSMDGKYIKRILDTHFAKAYFAVSANGLTRVGLSQYTTVNLPTPTPPLSEQAQIARFLDHETAKIDTLIAEQQCLIELLKEKRQAVISHAVTKGLDPSVPMKDSGVEWLGEVPAHWMMKKLKNVTSAVGGSTPSKEREDYWNGDVPWVSPKDMKSERIHDSIDRVTLMALNDTSLSLISEGAVLIVVRGMILLHSVPVAINDVSVTINQDMKAMRPTHVLSNDYLFLLLQGFKDALFQYIDTAAHGTRKLEWERFELLDLPLPPIHEQVEIVRNISSLKEKLEALMQSSHSMMVLLLERRSGLISAAVTGKIDVRGWRPPASSASSSQDNLNMETA